MTTTLAPHPHRLSRNTAYVLWLISDTTRGLAGGLFAFALPLLTLIVTDDPLQAGVMGAVAAVVRTVSTLYGGVVADRHPRVRLMILGSVIGVVLSAAFTALALTGSLTFAALLIVTALLAVRGGIFDVAGESAIKQIVPDGAMGRAQAANQARDAVLQLAGGPLGGALLTVGGWLVGSVMAVMHLIAAVTAALLQRRITDTPATATDTDTTPTDVIDATTADIAQPVASAPAKPKATAATEMREGFRWLLARADLRAALFIATVINLGFNAGLTTVVFALQQSGHSPASIGWVATGSGAAMLAGALIAPMLVPRLRAGVLSIAGLTAATLGVVMLSVVEDVWAITGVLAAAVLLLPAVNAALLGYFMVAVPTELLGRANSASMVLSMGAMPLGPLLAGFGLTWIGREGTLIVCAAICAIAAAMAAASRGLRSIPTEAGWSSHAARFAEEPPA